MNLAAFVFLKRFFARAEHQARFALCEAAALADCADHHRHEDLFAVRKRLRCSTRHDRDLVVVVDQLAFHVVGIIQGAPGSTTSRVAYR
jgi:hypothetical protein